MDYACCRPSSLSACEHSMPQAQSQEATKIHQPVPITRARHQSPSCCPPLRGKTGHPGAEKARAKRCAPRRATAKCGSPSGPSPTASAAARRPAGSAAPARSAHAPAPGRPPPPRTTCGGCACPPRWTPRRRGSARTGWMLQTCSRTRLPQLTRRPR